MNNWHWKIAPILPALAAGLVLSGFLPARASDKTLDTYTQPNLRDVTASVDVLSHNDRELAKIDKGYVDAYRLASQEIWCKEPEKVRFQGKKGIFTIRYVTNGNRKLTEVPTLRIRKVEDISDEPGKSNSISDIGLITPSWVERVKDRWLRTETREGKQVEVFEVWYKSDPRARHTITVDPTTKIMVEHLAHHRARNKPGFRKRWVFSEPKQINGVWVPTKCALYNGENKLAATMKYESIKVNSGLGDNLFTF